MSTAIEAANNIARTLEQIETSLADDDLSSAELAVLVASVTDTQDKLRRLLPVLISRIAIISAEEREAAATYKRTTVINDPFFGWDKEPDAVRKQERIPYRRDIDPQALSATMIDPKLDIQYLPDGQDTACPCSRD